MKEFVEKLRETADVFEKSSCAVDGIVKDYRKSADIIDGLYEKSNISGFVEKLIERLEEKIKVTSLEIIVTGTKDKPYFEIKYKEVGKEDYNIGYSSYELDKVFSWKEECFEIVNQLAEEYKGNLSEKLTGWIPVTERLPECSNEELDAIMDKILDTTQMEEKYTLEQIIDAIVQADEAVVVAIRTQDREMLEDVIKDFLT